MKINITEHKSVGALNPLNTPVRVFVNGDFHYGYFVSEHQLFGLLTDEQRKGYLEGDTACLNVSAEVAQQIIDMGHTPFSKRRVV